MLRVIVGASLLLTASVPAWGDARQDCARKSGSEAIAACDAALARNPNDAQSYLNRGAEYSGIREYQRAISDFTKAIDRRTARGKSTRKKRARLCVRCAGIRTS